MGKRLIDAHEKIRDEALLMRKCLASSSKRLPLAINHCARMLDQLRVRDLEPKMYYELYNACFDVLSQLKAYLTECHPKFHLAEVYSLVEYTQRVLPRLYLMITVGSAFIATEDAPEVEVLADMIGMAKGEQSPLAGLFLRYYLSQSTGEYVSKHAVNNPKFYTNWVLSNFIEMNKLWVRYQTMGGTQDYERRFTERKQLQTIVGSNILRLAQMDCVTNKMFCVDLLPRMVVQVIHCRDSLAQEYLLDVIVQAFPVEYHYDSLEIFLDCLKDLSKETSLYTVLQASMKRLEGLAETKRTALEEAKAGAAKLEAEKAAKEAEKAAQEIDKAEQETLKSDDDVEKQKKGEESATETVPTNTDSENPESDQMLVDKEDSPASKEASNQPTNGASSKAADEAVSEPAKKPATDPSASSSSELQGSALTGPILSKRAKLSNLNLNDLPKYQIFEATSEIGEFFQDAVKFYWSVITQLNMDTVTKIALVREFIDFCNQTDTSFNVEYLISFILQGGLPQSSEVENLLIALFDILPSVSEVLQILMKHPDLYASQSRDTKLVIADKVIDTLIHDHTVISSVEQCRSCFDLLTILFKSGDTDQSKVFQLVKSLKSQDSATTLDLLQLARRSLRAGGKNVISSSYPVLVTSALKLLLNSTPQLKTQVAKFVFQLCSDIANVGEISLVSFRMFLVCAQAFDNAGHGELSYEMFAGALSIYEEFLTKLRDQVLAMSLFIHFLQQASSLTSENYNIAANAAVKNCSTVIKKPEQCRLLLLSSHLFWDNKYSNAQLVRDTVAKALRCADAVMDSDESVSLFLQVLETEIYFFANNCQTVNEDTINNVFTLISENMSNADLDGEHNQIMHLKDKLDRISSFIEHQTDEFPQFMSLLSAE